MKVLDKRRFKIEIIGRNGEHSLIGSIIHLDDDDFYMQIVEDKSELEKYDIVDVRHFKHNDESAKDEINLLLRSSSQGEAKTILETQEEIIDTLKSMSFIFVDSKTTTKLIARDKEAIMHIYYVLGYELYREDPNKEELFSYKDIKTSLAKAEEYLADEFVYVRFGEDYIKALEKQQENIKKAMGIESSDKLLIMGARLSDRIKYLKKKI